MRWGLVPSWFKESDPSKLKFNTSNCRSDTIMEKRSFKVGSESREKAHTLVFIPAELLVPSVPEGKIRFSWKVCSQLLIMLSAVNIYYCMMSHPKT